MGHGAGKGCRIFRARWKGRIEGLLVSRLVLPSLQAPGTRVCKGGGGTVSLNGMPTMLRRDVIDAEGTVPIQHRQVVSLGL